MRKILGLLLVLAMLTLSACGVVDTTDNGKTTGNDNTTQNTEGTYVTFPWG